MKKFGKTLTLLLIVFMVFATTGCGIMGKPVIVTFGFSKNADLNNTEDLDLDDYSELGLLTSVTKNTDYYAYVIVSDLRADINSITCSFAGADNIPSTINKSNPTSDVIALVNLGKLSFSSSTAGATATVTVKDSKRHSVSKAFEFDITN